MRRKRFQEGSVKRRTIGGRAVWRAQWCEYSPGDGQPKSMCRDFPVSKYTSAEVKQWLKEKLRPYNEAIVGAPPRRYTFAEFVNSVYIPWRRRQNKASSMATAEQVIRDHVIPDLAETPIGKISRSDLQSVLDRKAAALSRSVVSHIRFYFQSIFALALSDGVVQRNPAVPKTLVTPPSCRPGRAKRVLAVDHIRILLGSCDLRQRVVVHLTALAGMRPGEVFALQIQDFRDDHVFVRRRVYRGNIDSPKTFNSERQVGLAAEQIELLREWVGTLRDQRPTAWLFPSERLHSPIDPRNVWHRSFRPMLDKIGLSWANYQVFRRTFATLQKEYKVDPKTVADQMGHTIDVNQTEYAITPLQRKREAVQILVKAVLNTGQSRGAAVGSSGQ